MHKYTHVEAIYQVARYVKATNGSPECPDRYKVRTPVRYRGTVKLHGANAGVVCHGGELVPQSRNRVISLQEEHLGFAAFVRDQTEAIRDLEQRLRAEHEIDEAKKLVLYGEWIGPGIQNGMAVNKLPDKQWVLFAAKTVLGDESEYIDAVRPLEGSYDDSRIFSVYDVPTWGLEIDFTSEESKQKAIEEFEHHTGEVEKACPWGRKFGIDGLGEGIVWIPVDDHWGNSDLFWKSKGKKHKEVKRAKRNKAALDPEVIASVEKFVEFSVTEPRLNKGIDYLVEMGHPIEMRSTGHFIKWVSKDVQRECAAELEANDLKWKQVAKAVGAKAKEFFTERVKAQ